MKSLIFFLLLFLASYFLNSADSQEYYQKGNNRLIRSNPDVPLVTAFDMQAFIKEQLPGFYIVEKHALYYTEVVYRLENPTTKFTLYIEVGLFPSVREAEGAKLDRLNMSTAWFKEGPILGERIGDNAWYYEESEGQISGVYFIRHNVDISIHFVTGTYDLLTLANSIDQDILNGASYLKIGDTISPPVIQSVDVSKPDLREGEVSLLTIHASDPMGKPFEYRSNLAGPVSGQPDNVFGVHGSTDLFKSQDPDVPVSGLHMIKLWVLNEDNLFSSIKEVQITFSSPSAVNDEDNAARVPSVFTLSQNTPNPFNPSTAIAFTLSRPERVNLTVYDVLGRTIASLASGNYPSGSHTLRWDGRDGRGNAVSSGVYLYRLEAGGRTETRKMLLAR